MPPLYEGSLLFMPTTLPGISVTEAQRLMQIQDQILRRFPEVERVFGKAGRAAGDRHGPGAVFDDGNDRRAQAARSMAHRHDQRQTDRRHGRSAPFARRDQRLDHADQKSLIDMLSTGIKTPVGIKILGADLETIEQIGIELEGILPRVPGTRSVFAERAAGEVIFLDFNIRRDALARYGLTVKDVETVLLSAIGGESVTTTIEGRERYTVSVRYPRDYRDTLDHLKRVLVPTPAGQIPLSDLADLEMKRGPSMIRNENGLLTGYVYVDIAGRDLGSYVAEAKRLVNDTLAPRPGYTLLWSGGQYENLCCAYASA